MAKKKKSKITARELNHQSHASEAMNQKAVENKKKKIFMQNSRGLRGIKSPEFPPDQKVLDAILEAKKSETNEL